MSMGSNQSRQKQNQEEYPLPVTDLEDWPWVWGIRDPEILDWKKGLTPDEITEQALFQQGLPVPITDAVYLGNAYSVQDVKQLEFLGIKAVLNMAGTYAVPAKTVKLYKEHGILYKQINAEDDIEYPLLEKHWIEANEFIQSCTSTGNKCVVNCVAGINRSGLIVSAYHMLQTQTPVLETVQHVRKQRGNVVLCNEAFQEQLVVMARKHGLLGAKPGTSESFVSESPWYPDEDWRVRPCSNRNNSHKRKENPLDRLSNL